MYQEVVGRILTHILKNDKSDEKNYYQYKYKIKFTS